MLTLTTRRISQSMSEDVNRRVREQIQNDIEYHREHPEEIDKRLDELSREWSLERILQTNASVLTITGALLGAFKDRRWLIMAGIPSIFLLLHGLTGWAPPIEGLRRAGFRTFQEIDEERCALMDMKTK